MFLAVKMLTHSVLAAGPPTSPPAKTGHLLLCTVTSSLLWCAAYPPGAISHLTSLSLRIARTQLLGARAPCTFHRKQVARTQHAA